MDDEGKARSIPSPYESARARTPDDDLELESQLCLIPFAHPTLHFFSLTQTVMLILTLGFVQEGRNGSSERAPPSMSTTKSPCTSRQRKRLNRCLIRLT